MGGRTGWGAHEGGLLERQHAQVAPGDIEVLAVVEPRRVDRGGLEGDDERIGQRHGEAPCMVKT
jgi:hypothetical protein